MKVFERIGENKKLGLTGRPTRPFGVLGNSKVYKILVGGTYKQYLYNSGCGYNILITL